MKRFLLSLFALCAFVPGLLAQQSLYDFQVANRDGKLVSLSDYRGKVLLIVNTATECGFTPQYNDLQRLDRYAARLGLAFQVIDDVLDCEADTATLGKTAGKDADNDKPTYVKLMGLSAARQYAETLVAEALETLEPFGSRAAHLRGLAQFVTARKN